MMQAYAEDSQLLEATDRDLDLSAIGGLWDQGGVVRSWVLERAVDAFKKDPGLTLVTGRVEDTGEGRRTVEQAIEHGVPVPAIATALSLRIRSRQPDSFAGNVPAALRNEVGGRVVAEQM